MTIRRSDDHARIVDLGMRIIRRENVSATSVYSLDDCCCSLAESLNAGTLSILIGAGMSVPCGIPGWPKLVQNLLSSYLSSNYTTLNPDLLRDHVGQNPIVLIRILRRLYELKIAFFHQLRNSLYANLTDPPTTPAIEQLAHLLVQTYRSGRPVRVITYNFDDLLEAAIATVDPAIPVFSVFSESQQRPNRTVFPSSIRTVIFHAIL